MTLISAYIELFIRGKSQREIVRGEFPDTLSKDAGHRRLFYPCFHHLSRSRTFRRRRLSATRLVASILSERKPWCKAATFVAIGKTSISSKHYFDQSKE